MKTVFFSRILALAVIAFNALLFCISAFMFSKKITHDSGTWIVGVSAMSASVLNIITAIKSWRSLNEVPRWAGGLSIAANILIGLFGLSFLSAHKGSLPPPAIFLFTTSLIGFVLIFLIRLAKKIAIPQGEESPQNIASKKLLRRSKIYEECRDVLQTMGVASLFFSFLIAQDSIAKDDYSHLPKILPYALVFSCACLLLWGYFRSAAKKEKYASGLVALGIDETEAKSTADREYEAGQIGQRGKEWWDDYYNRNRKEIDDLQKELHRILIEKYSIRPEAFEASQSPADRLTLISHYSKKSAARSAEEIYQSLVTQGQTDNPQFFKNKNTNSTDIKPSALAFNKMFYGSYNPSRSRKVWSMVLYLLLLFAVYGSAVVFVGPQIDLFVPTDQWYRLGQSISVILSLGIVGSTLWGRITGRLKPTKQGSKGMTIFAFLVLPVALYYLCMTSLVYGVAKAITQLAGEDASQTFSVAKDSKTDWSYGYRVQHHTTAYCVQSEGFGNAFMEHVYCLQKEHYDLLPTGETSIVFVTKKTFFGTVIKGYLRPVVLKLDWAPPARPIISHE